MFKWENTEDKGTWCVEVEQLNRPLCTLSHCWLTLKWTLSSSMCHIFFWRPLHVFFSDKGTWLLLIVQSLVYSVNILAYEGLRACCTRACKCVALLAAVDRRRSSGLKLTFEIIRLCCSSTVDLWIFSPSVTVSLHVRVVDGGVGKRQPRSHVSLFNFPLILCLLCQNLRLFWMFTERTVHNSMCTFPFCGINKMFYDPKYDHVAISFGLTSHTEWSILSVKMYNFDLYQRDFLFAGLFWLILAVISLVK